MISTILDILLNPLSHKGRNIQSLRKKKRKKENQVQSKVKEYREDKLKHQVETARKILTIQLERPDQGLFRRISHVLLLKQKSVQIRYQLCQVVSNLAAPLAVLLPQNALPPLPPHANLQTKCHQRCLPPSSFLSKH